MENRKQLYKAAIDTWGSPAQIDMAIEECAEFIQAVNKLRRAKSDQVENRIELLRGEIADCIIMMEQMADLFGYWDVERFKSLKLNRLEQRLKDSGGVTETPPPTPSR